MSTLPTVVLPGSDDPNSPDTTPAMMMALVAQPLPQAQSVEVANIDMLTHTSSRVSSNHSAGHFAELLADGQDLPAIILFCEKETGPFYVGDGWERLEAALDMGAETIFAHILPGTAEMAFLFHIWKNSHQGMPLTDVERHRALDHLLVNYTDAADIVIARMCNVTRGAVQRRRLKLIESGLIERTPKRRDSKGREFSVVQPRPSAALPTSSETGSTPVDAPQPAENMSPDAFIQAHASPRLRRLYESHWIPAEAIVAVVRTLVEGTITIDGSNIPLNPRVKALVEKHGLGDVQILPVLQRWAEAEPPSERLRILERDGSLPMASSASIPLYKCAVADFAKPQPAAAPPAAKSSPAAPAPFREEIPEHRELPVSADASDQMDDAPAVTMYPGEVLTHLAENSAALILNLGCLTDPTVCEHLGAQAVVALKAGGFLALELEQEQLSTVLPQLEQSLTFWHLVVARGDSKRIEPDRRQLTGCIRLIAIYTRPNAEGSLIPNPDWLSDLFDAASDEEIAAKLIGALTFPGEMVVDPFGDIGTGVQRTAVRWGRPWVGLALDADE